MIVNHASRWVYVGPPKTGSTTMHMELVNPRLGGVFVRSGLQHDTELPEGAEAYFKFATTRSPYARAASLYWHFLLEYRMIEAAKAGISSVDLLPFRSDLFSFAWFVSALIAGELPGIPPAQEAQDFYIRTTSWWLRDLQLDAILQLEQLETQFQALPIWHTKEQLPGFGRYNAPGTPSWQFMRNPAVIELIEQWADEDFTRFHYERLTAPAQYARPRTTRKLLVKGQSLRLNWLHTSEMATALAAHDIQLCYDGNAEAHLLISELQDLKLAEPTAPTVILDISDPVTLRSEIQRLARNPLVKAILRPYVFRDPSSYYKQLWQVDHHHTVTRETAIARGDTRHFSELHTAFDLTPEELLKIKLSYSGVLLSCHNGHKMLVCEAATQYAPLMERPLDVIFIGQLRYASRKLQAENVGIAPEVHREFMVRELETLTDLKVKVIGTNGNPDVDAPIRWISNHDFIAELAQARIVVSPWGWSCWSHRDYDAINSGALIVKPRCDDVLAVPDIFMTDSPWLYWCKPDMSDLCLVIRELLAKLAADPATYDQRHVIDNPERLRKACSTEQVASRIAGQIHEALGI